ncbi:hypothetical protein C5Y96_06350 [Blastopirellula marina]|uniref:Uncharacterized protein n=1 Tax=Blastopirellula marina TaxID=124 RepID=A0A2S8FX83_9BACT|nr:MULTISPECIES: hypothetical protein [Pirellulaceae]PQO36785.1 hypothetical protein C5Y96_06350 [Blastopirellula marina]RCS53500.1 hypothetical protein DTL36_06360 [Bremerella cremea]
MITFDIVEWEEAVRTALGRGGHLVAFLVALVLIATYMGGGQLLENPAKLVIGGFFVGFTMDMVFSICWNQMSGSKA